MNGATRARFVAGAICAATAIALLMSPALASASPSATPSWPYPNGTLANTRVASGSAITLANVGTLKEVWSFKLSGEAKKSIQELGSLAMTPIVVNNVVYIQDLSCNVYALSLATGALLWKYRVNTPEKSGPGPNGVAVAGGVVYGMTNTAAFALHASNGRPLWLNTEILKKGEGTFGIQPQVADGRVYLASQYGSGKGGGILLALNATTGKVIGDLRHRQSVPVASLGDQVSGLVVVHRQCGEPRRGDRKVAVVLPSGAE